MDLQDFIEEKKINKIIFSKNSSNLDNIVNKKFKFNDDLSNNIIYFGVYSKEDINILNSLEGNKYILFKNVDVDILLGDKELKEEFDKIDNKYILCSSENISSRLKYFGYYDYINIKINLVDNEIFKNVENKGNSIFINNGFDKNKPYYYGKKIIDELVERNPNYNYIYSNELDISYDKMIEIYKKCFIGLRVSNGEGLFLMEDEMYSMGIKTINNNSVNGLKWKSVEDIEAIIKNENIHNNEIMDDNKIVDDKLIIDNLWMNDTLKLSIVMAYCNRKTQTLKTLERFEELYSNKYNFEVVIVDDNSNDKNTLDEYIKNFSFSINLIKLTPTEKNNYIGGSIAYNKGFENAKGEIIIIQNPECFHVDNILEHTLNNLKYNTYISYSCYGLGSFNDNNLINNIDKLKNIIYLDNNIGGQNKTSEKIKIGGWLNHNIHNPTYYHYCCSILKKNLKLVGNFSIDLSKGFCYDDDELVRRLYSKNINLLISDKLVIHQYHETNHNLSDYLKKKYHFHNFQIMKEKSKIMNIPLDKQFIVTNNEKNNGVNKLAFSFWSGIEFSYNNYLSLESFLFYNPSYKFILYTDNKFNSIQDYICWDTKEHSGNINISNYYNLIYKLIDKYNFEIKTVENLDIELNNVSKCDYYRLLYLQKHGGLWTDLDIIYIKSIDELIDYENGKLNLIRYPYDDLTITTGLIYTQANNKHINNILKLININNVSGYQYMGPDIFNNYYNNLKDKNDISFLNSYSIYPFEWYDIKELYTDINLEMDFIGIHWYNGSIYTKKYLNKFQLDINGGLINDKYIFINKVFKKFLFDKINRFTNNYINFKFYPYKKIKNLNKINMNNKSINKIVELCETNNNYYGFDLYGNIYTEKINNINIYEYIDTNNFINGIYIKDTFNIIDYNNNLKLNDGCYILNNNLLNSFENKILYITHKKEFENGYGQLFRLDRYESLKNDKRFDVGDISEEYFENKCFYNKHKALITTHDCIRIEDKHPVDSSIHWCSHSLCGHQRVKTSQEWTFDFFKSYSNLLQLKTNEISHRIIILEDMHHYTFRGDNKNYYDKGIENMCKYLDKYYNFVIYHYESPELEVIKNNCNNIKKWYLLPHHINTKIYKKYTEKKEYDILFYGSVDKKNYPLRYKIKNALLKSDLNYIILKKPEKWNEINENCLNKLSEKINKSYITISDDAWCEYAVCKYFEIGASNSVIAGSQPKPINTIFGDNMIKLDLSMTEDEIIQTLKNALLNKEELLEKSNKMYNIIHSNYDLNSYNNKIENIVNDSLKYKVNKFKNYQNNNNIVSSLNTFIHYAYLFCPNILNVKINLNNKTIYFDKKEKELIIFIDENSNKIKTEDNCINIIKLLLINNILSITINNNFVKKIVM